MRRSSLAVVVLVVSLASACHRPPPAVAPARSAVTPVMETFGPSGVNGPLMFLDGKEVTKATTIDRSTIDNVEVLKGPRAAALYGDRALAGVVLITTKASNDPRPPQ